jgi:adenylate cyclase
MMSLPDNELESIVNDILYEPWDIRKPVTVPSTDSVPLRGGAAELDVTVLFTDLAQSSRLSLQFDRRVAATVVKAFVGCSTSLIKSHGGGVTSFDGDRVMGIFVGDTKNTDAVICALKINYAILKIVKPRLSSHFQGLASQDFAISHATGVDTGAIMAARAGLRGANDLVWIGRPPNFAAKLSDLREAPYTTFISADVFRGMDRSVKYGGEPERLMWERRTVKWLDTNMTIHRSSWWWKP